MRDSSQWTEGARAPGDMLRGRMVKKSEEGRTCSKCSLSISMYNPNSTCWVHTKPKSRRVRGRKFKESESSD